MMDGANNADQCPDDAMPDTGIALFILGAVGEFNIAGDSSFRGILFTSLAHN